MQVCAAPPFAADHALSCDARWRAHDLLRLHRLPQFDGEPAWVRGAFERAPYAVVRRALAADGFVAIGLRGLERSQRYGTWVHLDDIETAVPPEALARRCPACGAQCVTCFRGPSCIATRRGRRRHGRRVELDSSGDQLAAPASNWPLRRPPLRSRVISIC